ncbi:hypothetical protein [Methanosarcina barkeri]|uniref:hypothetical protein n=1 Tax=Methanosarcina barkeri TaxID=2208 RepID=UPI000AF7BA40|nr:hypothetical protein [Methanosarcina barkeri]
MLAYIKLKYDNNKKSVEERPTEKPVEENKTISFETGIEIRIPTGIIEQTLGNVN